MQALSRNKRKRQPIGMLGRSRGNRDWLLANACACVSCGFRLRNVRNASDCVWMETGLYTQPHMAITPFGWCVELKLCCIMHSISRGCCLYSLDSVPDWCDLRWQIGFSCRHRPIQYLNTLNLSVTEMTLANSNALLKTHDKINAFQKKNWKCQQDVSYKCFHYWRTSC